MECVLVLPVLMLLIFAVVQFALLWYAQIMTHYAAYNAARAALVYHPGDYREVGEHDVVKETFQPHSGVCWDAACRTLSWVSSSPGTAPSGCSWEIPGWGCPPNSINIQSQVRINTSASREDVPFVWYDSAHQIHTNSTPSVVVRVDFDFPLTVPVIGRMIAYFEHVEDEHPSSWEVTGWSTTAEGAEAADAARHPVMKLDYVTLHASCILPKPWSTMRFGRRPNEP